MSRFHLLSNTFVGLLGALPNLLTVPVELVPPILTFWLFVDCHHSRLSRLIPLLHARLGLPPNFPLALEAAALRRLLTEPAFAARQAGHTNVIL